MFVFIKYFDSIIASYGYPMNFDTFVSTNKLNHVKNVLLIEIWMLRQFVKNQLVKSQLAKSQFVKNLKNVNSSKVYSSKFNSPNDELVKLTNSSNGCGELDSSSKRGIVS